MLPLLVLLPSLAFGQGMVKAGPAQTNWFKFSNSISVSTAAQAPWTLTAATVSTVTGAPPWCGGGTWAELAGSNANGGAYYTTALPLASTLTVSVCAAKASGSGSASIVINCQAQNVATCTCSRSDGVACTATPSGTYCTVTTAGVTTTPVKLSTTFACVAPIANPQIYLGAGEWGVALGTTRFAGAQIEIGATPSNVIVTGDAARTRLPTPYLGRPR
jgi:hypothetical protein